MDNTQAIPQMSTDDIYTILNQVVDRVQLTGSEFKQVSIAMANLNIILNQFKELQKPTTKSLDQKFQNQFNGRQKNKARNKQNLEAASS